MYWLRVSAKTPTDDSQVTQFLDALKSFNLKFTERPMTVTSDLGDALGTNIESEIKDLPYKVRYSFDVCLAHGYLSNAFLLPL